MPDGLTMGWTPLMNESRSFILPSLCWCYSSSILLLLCPMSNLLRSHLIYVFHDRCFSLTSSEQAASCSNLFYIIWLRKREGHLLLPSAMSQWLAMAVTDIPVQYLHFLEPQISLPGILPLKLLPAKQRLKSLITWILDCPSFLMGTRIQEISPVAKWEARESVLDFHFPAGKHHSLKILFGLQSYFSWNLFLQIDF